MPAAEPKKRLDLTENQRTLIEELRDKVKNYSEGDMPSDDQTYAYGVIDALAFVWAGVPENPFEVYRGIMSEFAHLCRKADL